MGNVQSRNPLKWFCFCSSDTPQRALELTSDPRHTESGVSIQSDKFDETTQVIVVDTRTNKLSAKAKNVVEDNPRYTPHPVPERGKEVDVRIPIPGISQTYPVCKVNLAELGLDTKRQQGKIPYIYVTTSQPPTATQLGATANLSCLATPVDVHTSNRPVSSSSRRGGGSQTNSASSENGPQSTTLEVTLNLQTPALDATSRPQFRRLPPTTPAIAVPSQPSVIAAPSQGLPTIPELTPQSQARVLAPPPQPKPRAPEAAVQPQAYIPLPPSRPQPDPSGHLSRHSAQQPQHSSNARPSSSGTVGVLTSPPSQQARTKISVSPASLPTSRTPNG